MKKTLLAALLLAYLHVRPQQPTDKLLEFYNILTFSYVDSFDFAELSEKAIITMLAELDPHSSYIPADKVREMNESLEGEYDGIGVQFDMYRDTVLVVSVIPGGPSDLVGLISGDRIISANDVPISGQNLTDDDIISTLRGEEGSTVTLKVKRRGRTDDMSFGVVRGKIPIYAVDVAYMLDDRTAYIKINRFSRNTLPEFKQSIRELTAKGADQLVLDIRDNGGGYLMAAVELSDEFLKGRKEIVRTRGLRQSEQVYRAGSRGSFHEGRLVVLINEGSASASEIFAGAIQDWDRGLIIGRRSYGKGLVMKPFTFSDGSMVRLTTSKYYTPSGRCIQKDFGDNKEE